MIDNVRTKSVHIGKQGRTKMQIWLKDTLALVSLFALTWMGMAWIAVLDLT